MASADPLVSTRAPDQLVGTYVVTASANNFATLADRGSLIEVLLALSELYAALDQQSP